VLGRDEAADEAMAVPPINTPLLLDLLLGLIVLLFVPFGIRRGVAKEAMVSAAILWGALVATIWTEPWAAVLVERFDLERRTATFAVAVAILFGSAVLLGYGGGAALGRTRQGVLAHLAGGVLAALNGALLVALLLADVERYLPPWQELDDGTVSRFLLRDLDRLLLAAGALLFAWVALGVIVTTVRHHRQPRDLTTAGATGYAAATPPVRHRPVRMPREADAGKFEPLPGTTPPARPAGTYERTTPLFDPSVGSSRRGVTDDEQWRRPATGDRPFAVPPPAGNSTGAGSAPNRHNGHAPPPAAEDSWLRRAAAITRPPESDRPAQPPPASSGLSPEASWRFGGRDAANRDTAPEPPTRWGRACPTCGASVGATDSFCAECGRTL
jgi:uncharacterized membrane protein required for colicin V production